MKEKAKWENNGIELAIANSKAVQLVERNDGNILDELENNNDGTDNEPVVTNSKKRKHQKRLQVFQMLESHLSYKSLVGCRGSIILSLMVCQIALHGYAFYSYEGFQCLILL